jgi:ABC-type nitrate/sulfonate/bicarbonate transport system permease component
LAWTHISDPTALAAAFVDMIKDGSLPKALWASLEVLGLGFVSGAPD